MKNYIPIDFFENNKSTVYTSEKLCEKYEGVEAVEFDVKEIDLTVAKIVDKKIVLDVERKQQKEAEAETVKYKFDRKKEYEKDGLTFDRFVELLIEDDSQGIADFRQKRDAIKARVPKVKGQ